MAEGWRCDESETLISATSGVWPASRISDERSLIQSALYLLKKLSVRRPFGIPQSSRGMDRRSNSEAFQLGPERIVIGMSEVVTFDKHRPDECAAETWDLGDAAQLLDRVIHVLKRDHRRRKQSVWRGLAEVRDPVVVRAGERIRHVRIFDQVEALGKPGRIEKGLVDTHRIHIAQASLRVRSPLGHRMTQAWIEFTDFVPGHPGL